MITHIYLDIRALGDTIASIPYCQKYFEDNGGEVYVTGGATFLYPYLQLAYPNLIFNTPPYCDKSFKIELSNKKVPMQEAVARELGYNDYEYIKPSLKFNIKARPIERKYVVFSIHSTSQLKYWNHPNGKKVQAKSPNWSTLGKLLRKHNLLPVVVDKYKQFGISPLYNGLPSGAVKKIGMPFDDVLNHIYHAEFFVGPSSGLTWVSHALNQKTAMISGITKEYNEFPPSEDYIRIINPSVCNGCMNSPILSNWNELQKFKDDWYYCPQHKGTPRQFECHTSITPEFVLEKISKWL